jgi:2-desacetyl-2-hydroxyethyl bacteriochlorophyllide A dehydrogenase
VLALRKLVEGQGLSFDDVPLPEVGPGDVLIEVVATGICGSDLHIDLWAPSYHFIGPAIPVTLGHEFSGRLKSLGEGVTNLVVGQRVVVMPSVTCGICEHCRSGDVERCSTRDGIGVTRNGAFARFVAAPARNCLPIPDGVDARLAALTEPLTVSQQAVDQGEVGSGDRVLVLGPGSIGQGIAVLARQAGAAEVVVCGMNDASRLATVAALGFETCIDLANEGGAARLDGLTGDGFDVVIEATGAPAAIDQGLVRLRPGGIFVATGIHALPVTVDVTRIVRNQLQLRGSYRSPLITWNKVMAALAATPEAFAPMITHWMPLLDGLIAFAMAHRRQGSKILLLPDA